MKLLRLSLTLLLGLAGAFNVGQSYADTSVRWGISIGVPWVWHYPPPAYRVYPAYPYYYPPYSYSPYYNPYPYYYDYPPPVSAPPQYIEKDAGTSTQANPAGYWYYCRKPEGYYPYVRECAGGWERVAPVPSGAK